MFDQKNTEQINSLFAVHLSTSRSELFLVRCEFISSFVWLFLEIGEMSVQRCIKWELMKLKNIGGENDFKQVIIFNHNYGFRNVHALCEILRNSFSLYFVILSKSLNKLERQSG